MRKKNIFDKLLCQRAAALHYLAGVDVGQCGAQNAFYGNSAVIIKSVVLNSDKCLRYIARHGVKTRPVRVLADRIDNLIHIKGQIKFMYGRGPFLLGRQQAGEKRHSGGFFVLADLLLFLLYGGGRLGLIRNVVITHHAYKNKQSHDNNFKHKIHLVSNFDIF